MLYCPYKRTVYFYETIMDTIFAIILWGLLFSAFVRHVVRTIGFIMDLREKAKNRLSDRPKH